MKFFIILLCLLAICVQSEYIVQNAVDSNGFSYEFIKNDPLATRVYHLNNGLTVYLAENHDKPRIQTYIVVRAGSSYDPAETTGLAHYLEHMMFKGSSHFGTKDWEKESVLLEQIEELFEQHRKTEDPQEKKKIYAEIDKLSSEAAKYAIPNEYDKIVGKLGAKGTNAYTSNERTVFINDIPSNALERWLTLEQERFSDLVLRLFHTELETVYEEFNMYQDQDRSKVFQSIFKGLFPTHPYGTQTTIGLGEHLKNPSMKAIKKYFSTYYVPNNMAVCIVGDIHFDEAIKNIDATLGKLQPRPLPERKVFAPLAPMDKNNVVEVFGPSAETVTVAYRFGGVKDKSRAYVDMIDMLLCNSVAGLFDLNLVQRQRVLNAVSYTHFLQDYGMHIFQGIPRPNQKLEEVQNLMVEELEKIKRGEFEEWMLEAIVNDIQLRITKSLESYQEAASFFVEAFGNNLSWSEFLSFYYEELGKITKNDIVEFAKQNYNNYLTVYKKRGKDNNVMKVEKPVITPLSIDRNAQSEFLKEFFKKPLPRIETSFLDYDKVLARKQLDNGVTVFSVKNPTNDLFSFHYIFDMGKYNNIKLPLALSYLDYLGTDKYTPSQWKKELYRKGITLSVKTGANRSVLSIEGLQKSMIDGIEMLETFLQHVQPNPRAYAYMVAGILKDRENAKMSKDVILRQALLNYGKYGEDSPFRFALSKEELYKINPQELVDIIHSLFNYKHDIFYYGQSSIDSICDIIQEKHKFPEKFAQIPEAKVFKELEHKKSIVYVVDYDMVQANLFMFAKDCKYNYDILSQKDLFNEFFGGSMCSVIFQEIREAKALAYSAWAAVTTPSSKEDSFFISGFVGTQIDKLKTAVDAMTYFLNNMPHATVAFEQSKESLLRILESTRITKEQIFWYYLKNKDFGVEYDFAEREYNEVKNLTLDSLQKFFDEHVKNKVFIYAIIADTKKLDFATLEKLGTVIQLNVSDIFPR